MMKLTFEEEILRDLKEQADFVSGQRLAETHGLSRTAVWKRINILKQHGYEIESLPRRGYRLKSVPDLLLPAEIRSGLNTKTFGCRIFHHQEIDSTNALAKQLAARGAAEGAIVVAEQQRGGVGRLRRSWSSPKGGIWASIILRPLMPPADVPKITLVASEAVARTIEGAIETPTLIKWPNDVMVSGKKVAGILTEIASGPDEVEFVVLGIGLNADFPVSVLPAAVRGGATTLREERGEPIERTQLFRQLLENLEQDYLRLSQGGGAALFDNWRARSSTLGHMVTVATLSGKFTGVAKDIDSHGALVIEIESGEAVTVAAGDVTHLR